MNKTHNEWLVTHTAWILFAPVYLAELETEAPVPLPRWGLSKWLEFNFWINDYIINSIIYLINPLACGYMFWGVKHMETPKLIKVPRINPNGKSTPD